MAAGNPSYVKVNRGAIPTWSDFNALVDLVNRQRLRQGVGYVIHEGAGGTTLSIKAGGTPSVQAWPFKVYNTSKGSVGQVQINGGDGFTPTLNGFVANVNGTPANVKTGSPAAYPQLAVNGNGVVYAYLTPQAPLSTTVQTLDIYYGGTLPSYDTANPNTYYPALLATITDYAVGNNGNVTFTVSNVTNYGWTNFFWCFGNIQLY